MNAIHITHPQLNPAEYFFCHFNTEKDLKDFTATCPWFNPEEISIYIPEKAIIKHNIETGLYEKISPEYFKRILSKKLEVYNLVLREAQSFF